MKEFGGYLKGLKTGPTQSTEQSFTLDLVRARELASRYRLKGPWDFALKFVQAAHLGAGGLTIRGDSTFELWGWQRGGLEDIWERIQSPFDLHSSDAAGCLSVGLAALNAVCDLEIRYFQAGQSSGQRLACWAQQTEQPPEVSVIERPNEVPEGLSLLSIKLLWDQCPWNSDEFESFLVRRAPLGRLRFVSAGAGPEGHTLSNLRRKRVKEFVPDQAQWNEQLGGWYVLEPQRPGKKAVVRLMARGVVLEEHTFNRRLGPVVTVCADHLPTDLSGLQFVEGEEKSELVETAAALLARGVLTQKHLGRRFPTYTRETVACLALLSLQCLYHMVLAVEAACAGSIREHFHVVNLLFCLALVALFESNQHLRYRRQESPLSRGWSLAVDALAYAWLWGYLFLSSQAEHGTRHHQLDLPFTVLAWLPIFLSFVFNARPPVAPDEPRMSLPG